VAVVVGAGGGSLAPTMRTQASHTDSLPVRLAF